MADDGPSWSDIADWYDELLTAGSGPHQTALATLRELPPEVTGRRVLDVACGQGIATRALASLGAEAVGTDMSASMLANARRHGTPARASTTCRTTRRHWPASVMPASRERPASSA